MSLNELLLSQEYLRPNLSSLFFYFQQAKTYFLSAIDKAMSHLLSVSISCYSKDSFLAFGSAFSDDHNHHNLDDLSSEDYDSAALDDPV